MALAALTLGLIGVLFPLGRGLFLYPFHSQLGTLARTADFFQRPDFSDHRRALALDRGTPLARIPVVLFHQRAFQARPRHPLSRRITKPCRCCCGGRCTWFGSFPGAFSSHYALREFPRPKTWGPKMEPVQQARLLLFIWAGLILFFFSLTSGSRMEYYSFGAWPAIAVLLGNRAETMPKKRATAGCRACKPDSP